MANHYYFDIKLKLRDPDAVILTPAIFRSCVLDALDSFFCEEKPTLEIVKFCAQQHRVVFRVPEELHDMTRISIEHISHYQQIPCNFEILQTSKSSLDFEKSIEKTLSGLPSSDD